MMVSAVFMIPVFGASVGDHMPTPDPAWKHIYFNKSDVDKLFLTSEIEVIPSSDDNYYFKTSERVQSIKFRFEGTDLRLFGPMGLDMPKNFSVYIDDIQHYPKAQSDITENNNHRLLFEQTGLKNGIHQIEITTANGWYPKESKYSLYIDDIAINKNGKLLSIPQVQIGDELPAPERGWTRLDFTAPKYYGGDISNNVKEGFKVLSGDIDRRQFYTTKENAQFKFKFKGTQIRLVGWRSQSHSKTNMISIDGVSETFSSNEVGNDGINNFYNLHYEKTGLSDTVHEVVLTCGPVNLETTPMYIRGVDINQDGQLMIYDDPTILNIEPDKSTINLSETVTTNLVINNITGIAAEDILIDYDQTKLEYVSMEEIPGIKIAYSNNDSAKGQLRLILASQGKANVVNAKKILLKIKFKGISAGDGLIDITKAKVTDGITLEKDLEDDQCGEATITIIAPKDVNRTGEFTLLDLGIDALHFGEDPKAPELSSYDTDVVINNAIDDADLLKIAQEMMANSNYALKN